MSYHPFNLKLSMAQLKKLANGETVRIDPKHHGGNEVAHLTKAQVGKLQKALANKKGVNLKLSQAQISHHKKLGGNIFSSIWSGIKKGVSTAVDYVKNNPEKALEYARKGLKMISGVGITLTPEQMKHIVAQQKKQGSSIFLPGRL